jgi:hypothetical protein
MATDHIRFIEEVLYIYNCEHNQNDYKKYLQAQRHNEYVIRARPKYQPLPIDFVYSAFPTCRTDIFLFASTPNTLASALDILAEHPDIESINVIAESESGISCWMAAHYPNIACFEYTAQLFKRGLETVITQCRSAYILFAQDYTIPLLKRTNLKACMQWLKRTHAEGVFIGLNSTYHTHSLLNRALRMPYLLYLKDGIVAWQLKQGEYEWRFPHITAPALYFKEEMLNALRSISYSSFSELRTALAGLYRDSQAVGLCYNPLNI